jgi:hypothetical protein
MENDAYARHPYHQLNYPLKKPTFGTLYSVNTKYLDVKNEWRVL